MKIRPLLNHSRHTTTLVRLTLLLVACLCVALGAGSASAQTIYVTGTNDAFGSFDLGTRQYTQISASLGGGTTYNLTPNGSGAFFGTQNSGSGFDTFVGITTAGVVTTIGAANGTGNYILGLARAANGTVYAYGQTGGTVGTENTTTGGYASIGNAGVTDGFYGGSLAFSMSTLYGISNSGGLYTVNTTTGAYGTQIGANNTIFSGTSDALFGYGSSLYVINADNLYTVNTTSGATTLLGALTGTNLPTAFYAASAVPEPSTWALLVAGAIGVASVVLRRALHKTERPVGVCQEA